MKRLQIHRVYPEYMVDNAMMRRRGFRVLGIGRWRITWLKHPEDWRL